MNHSDPLELKVQELVRDLPPRMAPGTLEGRVRRGIASRVSRPWWRRSFVEWPVVARAAFAILCAAAVGVWVLPVLGGGGTLSGAADSLFRLPAPVAGLFDAAVATWSALRAATGAIPMLWLYAIAAVVAAIYGTLVGLGAIAFRAFQVTR